MRARSYHSRLPMRLNVEIRTRGEVREGLFNAARRLSSEGDHGPAIVVAQTAVEVEFERAIDVALLNSDTADQLREWLTKTRDVARTWEPTDKRLQRLWRALTGDVITDATGWHDYKVGVTVRNGFIHRGEVVSEDRAKTFIAAAEQIAVHMRETVAVETAEA